MKKQKFTPILGDLNRLSPEQQQNYVLAACEFLQVPAELGLVVLAQMDTGDGARQLLLYAKKGATDIIRDRLKISVDSLTPTNGDGYVGFTAVGHDSTGRQEVAVGTVSVRGITGQAVANAVMTAQTKALRRMTLQFAGGGFLDETEVNEKTVNLATAATPLKELTQPKVAPSAVAGTDITDASKAAPASPPTPVVTPQSEPLASLSSVASATEPGRKRRGRPRKTVSLDSPSFPGEKVILENINHAMEECSKHIIEPTPSEILQADLEPLPETKSTTIIIPPDTQVISEPIPFEGTKCTDEQKADFRKRFSLFVNDVLPKAGFLQSTTLGSRNTKLTLFVQVLFPRADIKNLSFEQWTGFFAYMDRVIAADGAEQLVKIINEKIGETQ